VVIVFVAEPPFAVKFVSHDFRSHKYKISEVGYDTKNTVNLNLFFYIHLQSCYNYYILLIIIIFFFYLFNEIYKPIIIFNNISPQFIEHTIFFFFLEGD